jgi:hypothetical protein
MEETFRAMEKNRITLNPIQKLSPLSSPLSRPGPSPSNPSAGGGGPGGSMQAGERGHPAQEGACKRKRMASPARARSCWPLPERSAALQRSSTGCCWATCPAVAG